MSPSTEIEGAVTKPIISHPEVPSLEAVLNSEGGTEQEATPTQQEAAPSFARKWWDVHVFSTKAYISPFIVM